MILISAEERNRHGRRNVKRLSPSPADAAGADAANSPGDCGHEGPRDRPHHRPLLR